MTVVGVVGTAALDTRDATEFLRTLAAFVALETPVRLFEVGPGVGALSSDARDLSADGEHYLTALREEGVALETAADLPAALATAHAVVVLADPRRPGVPAILALPRGTAPGVEQLADLLAAGQVRLG